MISFVFTSGNIFTDKFIALKMSKGLVLMMLAIHLNIVRK